MKTKFFMMLVYSIVILSNVAVFARIDCDDLEIYRSQNGFLKKNTVNENDIINCEFRMLFESGTPNFQYISFTVLRIFSCANSSEEHRNVLLNEPDSKVSRYAKKILELYETNKQELTENIGNMKKSGHIEVAKA